MCSHTRHENQREGGPAQFDHYAIQTFRFKFIRLELHAAPEAMPRDWGYRVQAIAVRCHAPVEALGPGAVLRELYDLERDPGEGQNLYPDAGEDTIDIARDLEAKLDAWVAQCIAARPREQDL